MASNLYRFYPKGVSAADNIETYSSRIVALIDEIGSMSPIADDQQKQIKALQKQLQPYAGKMKELIGLVSAISGYGPDETFVVSGTDFTASASKRYGIRTVTDTKLAIKMLNKVGSGIGWSLAALPLGKLDAFLAPNQKEGVITVSRGDRSVQITKNDPD